ncbi:site-specific recombinase XerD [Rhizobium sp. SG570]|jgi:site-specific recombinase XerD|nr:site-specific recombinase XerD [Rhizobium sp. SG570]
MTPLRQRMSEDMQVRNLSLNTQLSYLQQVSLFARHFGKSPDLLGREDIRTYQVYLANEKKLMPGSIHIAISALRFFFNVTLERAWGSIATSQEAPEAAHGKPGRYAVSDCERAD